MTHETDTPDSFDPMVDIFVGLACVVFLVILLILPFAQTQTQRTQMLQEITQQVMTPQAFTVSGKPALQVLIREQTVIVANSGAPRSFHQDELIGNPALGDLLRAAGNMHPLLFVDPSGQEALFLFETILARHGFREITRVYLDQHCGFLKAQTAASGCALP